MHFLFFLLLFLSIVCVGRFVVAVVVVVVVCDEQVKVELGEIRVENEES